MGDSINHSEIRFPDVRESRRRLRRAGWEVGATQVTGPGGPVWIVSGYNGENQLRVAAPRRDEAWWRACEAAQAVGMLGFPRVPTGCG